MRKTKTKILKAALQLFNANGLVNVRLQHIADEALISVGNLAYHYPNKESIVLTLYQDLEQAQRELLKEFRIVPLFDYLDHLLVLTFELQQRYVFFYLDTLEIVRAYPSVRRAHQQHIQHQIQQFKAILGFNTARGVLRPEPEPGFYEAWARQIWHSMDSWPAQQRICGAQEMKVADYQAAVWSLLVPLLSPMGHLEYKQMKQMRDTQA